MEELEAVENYLLRGLYPASGLSKGEKANLQRKAYEALYWLKLEDFFYQWHSSADSV